MKDNTDTIVQQQKQIKDLKLAMSKLHQYAIQIEKKIMRTQGEVKRLGDTVRKLERILSERS